MQAQTFVQTFGNPKTLRLASFEPSGGGRKEESPLGRARAYVMSRALARRVAPGAVCEIGRADRRKADVNCAHTSIGAATQLDVAARREAVNAHENYVGGSQPGTESCPRFSAATTDACASAAEEPDASPR